MVRSDSWDPLFGPLGFLAVMMAAVGLAFVARSWWTLLAALAVSLLYGERVVENDPLGVAFTVIFLTPAVLALFAVATAVGRRLDGGSARTAGVVALAVAAGLTSVGLYLDIRVVDESPADPLAIDVRSGEYRGLRIGLRPRDVRRRVGPPVRRGGVEDVDTPIDLEYEDFSSPYSTPAWRSWRYEGMAVFFLKGQMQGFVTTSERSETREGVGIGDSLEIAERRYRGLECGKQTLGETSIPESAYCTAGFGEDRHIWFGGDPIDAIWLFRDTGTSTPGRLAVR